MPNSKLIIAWGVILAGVFFLVVLSIYTEDGGNKNNNSINEPLVCKEFQYSDWSSCTESGEQYRTITKILPIGCSGGNPIQSQKCIQESTKNKQGQSAQTFAQNFNKIVQKIKSAPNSTIVVSKENEVGHATFYYSVVSDPLIPGSKDALVFETETIAYVDENGQEYSDKPISDYFLFKDTDFDGVPNEYWSKEFGTDFTLKQLNENTRKFNDLLLMWSLGFKYFNDNLLNN